MILLLAACSEPPQSTGPAVARGPESPAVAPARTRPLACDETPATPAPKGCITGELRCGDLVTGTTIGGDAVLDNDLYDHTFCFPRGEGAHDGPERVYRFLAPEYQQATIKLESPCADLDLVALAWDWDGSCPAEDVLASECEADISSGGGKLRLDVFQAREYLVIVDGKRDAVGPYTLSVACTPIRRPGEE